MWRHPSYRESQLQDPYAFFLLDLMFGPLIGIHLEIIAHLALGFGGAYLLARVLEAGKLGAIAPRPLLPAAHGTTCISRSDTPPLCP